ncbi:MULTISPECIES: FeoA family protein [Micromonospora]|uniref:Ferrous iron transport protein A n=1 Tax=Micromonospora solifontis TaxID=2487138 RepID=A0ABX9W9Y7_9ACTN|nr:MULTISPECIES: FeoA family protein [Micromonospora]NES15116.1 ferrous iron transport protein A [Micromonospora sp. PPF5-17B]NES39140.1 ferrous iron transport protein A [Micromonospora solifontis]NES56209.1 ferrous iron transport protein A [Micromonospora sp. PPF5-6]RNL90588.1 ferrous iron transport protein A [Micromonospora solifontis]
MNGSTARGRRTGPPGRYAGVEVALAELRPGAEATVVRVESAASPAIARRLADLGFTPGTRVRVERRAPLRDPVLYRLRDYVVCLRRAQAACVRVIGVGA